MRVRSLLPLPLPLAIVVVLLLHADLYQCQLIDPLQPGRNLPAIPTNYSLFDEIRSWESLSVFNYLLRRTNLTSVLRKTRKLLIFVPTDSAFYRTIAVFKDGEAFPQRPNATDLPAIFEQEWTKVSDALDRKWPTLYELLAYHLYPGDYTEQEIADAKQMTPLKGPDLTTSSFPTIFDKDSVYIKTRLYRQIRVPTGQRISLVNNVLLPIDAKSVYQTSGGSPKPTPEAGNERKFEPLQNAWEFFTLRNDLKWLAFMVEDERFNDFFTVIVGRSENFHILAPTDKAFMTYIEQLFPEYYEELRPETKSEQDYMESVDRIVTFWNRNKALPKFIDTLMYHLLQTSLPLSELSGLQNTDLTIDGVPAKVEFTDNGIEDRDADRDNANVIISLRTGTANITIIDSVLSAHNLEKLKAAVDPEPIESPEATEEEKIKKPKRSPKAKRTPKPPKANFTEEEPECFPASGLVDVGGRSVRMGDLAAGMSVRVSESGVDSSDIYLFTHRIASISTTFIRATTRSGHRITLSAGHLLYTKSGMKAAKSLVVGDILFTTGGPSSVHRLERVHEQGLYAPHTLHGDLMVDGIRVSSYTEAIRPVVAHALLWPVRMVARLGVREPLGGVLYRGGTGWRLGWLR